MALVQATLKNNLLSLFNAMKQAEMSDEEYANRLSKIINDHIKTAEVTVDAGIGVQVAPSTGNGATNAPGTGGLS